MTLSFLFSQGFHLSKHITISGNFNAGISGAIAGIIKGDVNVSADLTVEKGSIITGDVHANNLTVKGIIHGNIYCEGKVYAAKNSQVHGNIVTSEAIIDKESIIKGTITQLHPTGAVSTSATSEPSIEIIEPVNDEDPAKEEVPQSWF